MASDLTFIQLTDYGNGPVAIFHTAYAQYEDYGDGRFQSTRRMASDRPSLEIRIRNCQNQGLDTSVEEAALVMMREQSK